MGRKRRVLVGVLALAVALAVAFTVAHFLRAPGEPIATFTGVFYVPSCGHASVGLDGTTWYAIAPVTDRELEKNPPTPGDGQGTIVIYRNGRAHWTSGGGTYSSWLTTVPPDYSSVC